MAKRNAAPPNVADFDEDLDETQADRELDEELDGTLSAGEDDGGDLWDGGDDDDDEDDSSDADAASDDEDEPGDAEFRAADVSTILTSFTTSTLPKRMLAKTLGDQSNEWVLNTIARLVDEFREVVVEDRDQQLAGDLDLLVEAAEIRGIQAQLDETAYVFASGVVSWYKGKLDDDANEDEPEDEAAPSIDHQQAANSLVVGYVGRHRVHPDPLQPRQHADPDLRDSIRALGILQPITVRRVRGSDLAARAAACGHCATSWAEIARADEYVIVDGERRWQGAEGVLDIIPVIVRDDQGDTYERLRTQLVANTGKPLTPIEEARTFQRMLESRELTIAQLARDIGRPPSTVHDRVKLLELGPWLPWIESGSVTVSMAVQQLVPLRGIPDEYHAQAIAKLTDGFALGEEIADSIDNFGHDVADAYDKFMYPLTKTKSEYEKQPLFNTKAHDAECSCGGIIWAGSYQGLTPNSREGRRSCGNPGWWKPLDAAAKKVQREKEKDGSADAKPVKKGELRLELPAGTPAIKSTCYSSEPPKGVVVLTSSEGKWSTGDRWHVNGAFDPADLTIDDSKLVRIRSSYGLDKVGTKDIAAVEAARAKWRARFEPQHAAAAKKLLAEFEKLEPEIYAVTGPGVHALLSSIDVSDRDLREVAELLGIAAPEKLGVEESRYAGRTGTLRDEWVAKTLKRGDAERIIAFLAFMWSSEKRQLPSNSIARTQQEAIEAITAKRAPWATTKAPKAAAAKTSSKTSAKKSRGGGGEPRPLKSKQLTIDDELAADANAAP